MSEIKVRPAAGDDQQFLKEVYFSTRAGEMAAFSWDEAQIIAFLEMQFQVRQQAYRMQFPNAEYSIVTVGEDDVGCLTVERSADRIRLVDIAILPEYRENGIASKAIKQLQEEADQTSKPIGLRVDKTNDTAMRVYKKHSFVITGETQVLYEMEWRGTADK